MTRRGYFAGVVSAGLYEEQSEEQIRDWAKAVTSAVESYRQREGVCKDPGVTGLGVFVEQHESLVAARWARGVTISLA